MIKKESIHPIEVVDDLNNLLSVLETCVWALENKEAGELSKMSVAHTIFMVLKPFIEQIQEKVREL